ncbi:MAG: 2,4-dichlorophenol 6-monooxygenase, partial [Burkholderiales bacterium]
REAAVTVAERLGVRIDVVQIEAAQGWRDATGQWARVRGVNDDGAVLVRPDAHVGWRSHGLVPDGVTVLGDALSSILRQASAAT